MSTNAELAEIFDQMAALLQIKGANAFRVNAYTRAAEVLRDTATDVGAIAGDEAKLTAIEGIGAAIAKKIADYVRTGAVPQHQALLEEVPAGLLEVMAVPGVGPKTVRSLWQEGGVTDMASLEAGLDSGVLEGLPRMGAKTLANIRSAIAYAREASRRTRLGTALPLAEAIGARLSEVPGARRVACAGSLRRGRETIGDIDILAVADDPGALSEAFRAMDGVSRVLAAGSTKSSVRLERGIQVDLRVVDESAFGAALMYFTGSKDHNVALRERAVKRGQRLNEYGLFPDDGDEAPPQERGVEPVASATEEDVYAALELPWLPPELREERAWIGRSPPPLIEVDDVAAELHAHTVASDGRFTIDELAEAAAGRGFHTIAVTDHSRSSVQANGLDPQRLLEHVEAIREADARHDSIRILAGSEVDILTDGRLDYDDEVLARLDIVVASPHAALTQEPATATKRLLAAIRHPLVDIVGHPTGRVIGRREGLAPDVEALAAAAAEHDTALEINASPYRLDLRDTHVAAAMRAGALIAINTDAHSAADLDTLRYGVITARRGAVTADRCINTWPAERLSAWLAAPALPMNRIILGDNLDVLPTLPERFARLLYIDPPFNTGRRQQRQRISVTADPGGDRRGFGGRRYRTETTPSPAYDDRFDDLAAHLLPRIEASLRCLTDDASIFVHLDPREVHYVKVALDELLGRDRFMNEIIWAYDFGGRPRRRWPAKHDTILWYALDPGRYVFDYDAIDRIPYMAPSLVGPEKAARGKTPTDVWWHTIVPTSGREKTGYPTQKPLGILERIVRVHSEPGDTVLDFYAGSGTTGEAAARHGRRFVLVDESPEAVEIMRRRLGEYEPVVGG